MESKKRGRPKGKSSEPAGNAAKLSKMEKTGINKIYSLKNFFFYHSLNRKATSSWIERISKCWWIYGR